MAGESDRDQHVAHARVVLVGLVEQAQQQLGELPRARKAELDPVEGCAEDGALRDVAAQARVALLHALDAQARFRREGPAQDLGGLVQQRRHRDLVRIHVVAQDRPVACELRRAPRPRDDLQRAEQRLRVRGQPVLQRFHARERIQKRRDAHHHDRAVYRRDVMILRVAPAGLKVCEHLDRHQRVGEHRRGDAARVDRVLLGAQRVERAHGAPQHRNVLRGQERDIVVDRGQR